MRREVRAIGFAILGLVVLTTIVVRSAEAEATHTSPAATPTAPQCLASPRSFEDLRAILATPQASPVADSVAATIPEGTPIDTVTLTGISTTVQELIACFNAGEVLGAYALYSPDYLREIFSNQDPLTRTNYDERAAPHPSDLDEQAVIREISDARIFDDGSAGAYVTIEYPLIPVPKTFFFTFVRIGDRWLIDGALGETSFTLP
jgi:hypothetical protein